MTVAEPGSTDTMSEEMPERDGMSIEEQIQHGRDYIRRCYGSPEGMRKSWESMGWYDQGGDVKINESSVTDLRKELERELEDACDAQGLMGGYYAEHIAADIEDFVKRYAERVTANERARIREPFRRLWLHWDEEASDAMGATPSLSYRKAAADLRQAIDGQPS